MVVLGISGRRRHAAAAIAVDGRLRAAVTEASVTRLRDAGAPGGFPAGAARACAAVAGVDLAAVDRVVAVGEPASWPERGRRAAGLAHAVFSTVATGASSARLGQAALAGAPGLVVTLDARGGRVAVARHDGTPATIAGASALLRLARRVAWRIGALAGGPHSVLAGLEHVARRTPTDPDAQPAHEAGAIAAALAGAVASAGPALADGDTPRIQVQRLRAGLAEAVLASLAAEISRALVAPADHAVVVAGPAAAAPDFVARLHGPSRPVAIGPGAGPEGLALGGALTAFDGDLADAFGGEGLALGPTYSESDVKLTLDNARLDYLYEPQWPRLLDRVSRLLGRGKLVAWHHGPAEFGSPYAGSRCVLCDPSQRFGRDNVNRFFRHVPIDAPVLLVTTAALAEAFTPTPVTPWAPARVAATAEAREWLRGGLEPTGAGQVFVVPASAGSRLASLVERHHARTGVPALISVPLAGQGDTTACAPRDAVRTTFSSAVDALVIERFMLMKDYWLLRSDEGATA